MTELSWPADPPGEPSPPRRRTWVWVVAPLVLTLLVCGGLAGGSYLARKQAATADPAAPRASASPSAAPSTSGSPVTVVALALPPKLLGRAKSTDKALTRLAGQAVAERKTQTPGIDVIAAYYGSFARKNLVFVLAVRTPSAQPQIVLAQIRTAMQTQQKDLILSSVAAGPLGGVAECGDATAAGTPMAVCVWVDGGSYGFLQFFGASAAKVGDQFRTARGQIEKPV